MLDLRAMRGGEEGVSGGAGGDRALSILVCAHQPIHSERGRQRETAIQTYRQTDRVSVRGPRDRESDSERERERKCSRREPRWKNPLEFRDVLILVWAREGCFVRGRMFALCLDARCGACFALTF